MKHEQFEASKVGDIVVLRRGLDQERKAEVVSLYRRLIFAYSFCRRKAVSSNQSTTEAASTYWLC